MIGRKWGGRERMLDTVDLPVAIEPVRPINSIVWDSMGCRVETMGGLAIFNPLVDFA